MAGKHFRLIVVGGGLAGLAAAVALSAEDNVELVLVEKGPFLGGRCSSIDYRGRRLDLGQHLHMAGFVNYLKFLDLIGLSENVWTQDRLRVPFLDETGRRRKIESIDLPPPFHLLPALVRFSFLSPLDRVRSAWPAIKVWLGDKEEEGNFGDWLADNGVREEGIEKLWNPLSIATLNSPVDRAGLRFGAMVTRKLLLDKEEGRLGRLTVPLGRIGERAEELLRQRGVSIKKNSAVAGIVREGERVRGAKLASGREIEADAVLSAVPGHRLSELLPEEMVRSEDICPFWRLKWNSILNLHLFYEEEVMEEKFFGALGTLSQWVFNVNFDRNGEGAHVCVTVSDPGELAARPSGEVVDLLSKELEVLLPKTGKVALKERCLIKQAKATIEPRPGVNSMRPAQKTPWPGLFLAGDWTATGWPSTMEGAVKSGFLAARAVKEEAL